MKNAKPTMNEESSRTLIEKCKDEWIESPQLRKEFTSIQTYTAFKKAEALGKTKIIKGKELNQ